jgi:hypothetical protein
VIDEGKIVVSLLHAKKDRNPIDVSPLQLLKFAVVREEQSSNAVSPIDVMELLEGIITVDRREQPVHADVPIVVRDLEKVIERRFVHAPNWFVIDVIVLFDISNEPDRLVHLSKASFPNTVRDIGENMRMPVPEQF